METKYVNKIESEDEQKAREVMYELAKKRGLLPQIIQLCVDARYVGGKIGTKHWTVNGLLSYLGKEIEEKEEVRLPYLSEDIG